MSTVEYTRLHGVNIFLIHQELEKGYRGHKILHAITQNYRGLQEVTRDYTR